MNKPKDKEKNAIQVWWHCLWNMFEGHRFTKVTLDSGKKVYCCDTCGYGDYLEIFYRN